MLWVHQPLSKDGKFFTRVLTCLVWFGWELFNSQKTLAFVYEGNNKISRQTHRWNILNSVLLPKPQDHFGNEKLILHQHSLTVHRNGAIHHRTKNNSMAIHIWQTSYEHKNMAPVLAGYQPNGLFCITIL